MVKRSKRKHHVMSVSQAKSANKRLKKNARRKPQESATLSKVWDSKKTARQNMADAGLVFKMADFPSTSAGSKPKKSGGAVEAMEVEAASQQRPAHHRLAEPQVLFCVHMIERYDNDYQAMARDSTNHYQETPKQIRKKIEHFRRTAQYKAYLAAKTRAGHDDS